MAAKTIQLKQAVVQIKTLVIENKQMTLAVLRQIPSEPLLNPTGETKGKIWGHVNYFLQRGLNEKDHIQIIWQSGEQLRRCVFNKKTISAVYKKQIEAINNGSADDNTQHLINSLDAIVSSEQLYVAV